jgi:hypothetical protein
VLLLLLQVDAADNIDLLTVLQEFEEGYEAKYGRRPKLVRRIGSEEVCMQLPQPLLLQQHVHANCSTVMMCNIACLRHAHAWAMQLQAQRCIPKG